jgi:hypothetical protein
MSGKIIRSQQFEQRKQRRGLPFTGILIEHYAGRFPAWRAPVQAMVLPVADRHNEYAMNVAEQLEAAGVRVVVLEHGEYRERHAQAGEEARGARRAAYVACHVNAGGGDYGLVVFDGRSVAGRALAGRLVEALLIGYGDPGREGIALVQLCGDLARRLNASPSDIDKARFVSAAVVAHNLSRARAIWSAPVAADFDAHLGPLALPVKALAPALFDGGKTMPEELVSLAVFCTFVFAQTAGSTCPAPWQPIIASMRARRLPSVALEALTRALEG